MLGCGGTIARLAKEGHEIYITILGEGIASRYCSPDQMMPLLIDQLHECSRKVAYLLGAKDLFTYNMPDNRFDTFPLLDLVKIIEGLISDIHPQIIYTHHGGDLNIDHQISYRAVLTATRPIGGEPVQEIYAFEVPSSTEWAFQHIEPNFRPNVFVDISATIDIKVAALSCYKSEIRKFPHPRSPEAIHNLARYRGIAVGREAAEAFELIRAIR